MSSNDHDSMTCEWEDCPECEEARSQSKSKWIWFRNDGTSPSGKTKLFAVMTRGGSQGYDEALGVIKWHGPWRKYIFDPLVQTIYEQDCLRDIAKFLDELMEERKR